MLLLAGTLGCYSSKDRPRLSADVPVHAVADTEGSGATGSAPALAPLNGDPARAQDLKLDAPLRLTVPIRRGKAPTLWFRLPRPSRDGRLRLGIDGDPGARWALALLADRPGVSEEDPPLLETAQTSPGSPLQVTGLRAGPDRGRLLLRVRAAWLRPKSERAELHLRVDGTVSRPDDEAEPSNNRASGADPILQAHGLRGTLDHPGDRDCVRLLPADAGPEACRAAQVQLDSGSRRPVQLAEILADGSLEAAPPMAAGTSRLVVAGRGHRARGFCLSVDERAERPVGWRAVPSETGCATSTADGAPDAASPPPERLVVGPGDRRTLSRSVPASGPPLILQIEAEAAPVLVRVEGPVRAEWVATRPGDGTERIQPFVPAGATRLLEIRPGARSAAPPRSPATTGSLKAHISLRALPPAPLLGSDPAGTALGPRGGYTGIPPGVRYALTLPASALTTPRSRWRLTHLGAASDGPLKVDVRDREDRPVTLRRVEAGKASVLVLPADFAPYRITIEALRPGAATIPFGLLPDDARPRRDAP